MSIPIITSYNNIQQHAEQLNPEQIRAFLQQHNIQIPGQNPIQALQQYNQQFNQVRNRVQQLRDDARNHQQQQIQDAADFEELFQVMQRNRQVANNLLHGHVDRDQLQDQFQQTVDSVNQMRDMIERMQNNNNQQSVSDATAVAMNAYEVIQQVKSQWPNLKRKQKVGAIFGLTLMIAGIAVILSPMIPVLAPVVLAPTAMYVLGTLCSTSGLAMCRKAIGPKENETDTDRDTDTDALVDEQQEHLTLKN